MAAAPEDEKPRPFRRLTPVESRRLISLVARFDSVTRRVDAGRRTPKPPLYSYAQMRAMPGLVFSGLHVIRAGYAGRNRAAEEENAVQEIESYGKTLMDIVFEECGDNAIIAGGAPAVACASGTITGDADYDVFFHGVTQQVASETLARVVARIEGLPSRPVWVRTRHAITVAFTPVHGDGFAKFQFILRLYETAAQVIASFDVQCCSVMYTSQRRFMFTLAGAFAQRYRMNTLDPSRRSLNYEIRLSKYQERGFSTVIPLRAVPTGYLPELADGPTKKGVQALHVQIRRDREVLAAVRAASDEEKSTLEGDLDAFHRQNSESFDAHNFRHKKFDVAWPPPPEEKVDTLQLSRFVTCKQTLREQLKINYDVNLSLWSNTFYDRFRPLGALPKKGPWKKHGVGSEKHILQQEYNVNRDQDYCYAEVGGRVTALWRKLANLRAILSDRADLIARQCPKGVLAAGEEKKFDFAVLPSSVEVAAKYAPANILQHRHTLGRWLRPELLEKLKLLAEVFYRIFDRELEREDDAKDEVRARVVDENPELTAAIGLICDMQCDEINAALERVNTQELYGPVTWAVVNPGGQGRLLTGSVMPGRQALPLSDLYGEHEGEDFAVSFKRTLDTIRREARTPTGTDSVFRDIPDTVLAIIDDWLGHFSVAHCPRLLGLA